MWPTVSSFVTDPCCHMVKTIADNYGGNINYPGSGIDGCLLAVPGL